MSNPLRFCGAIACAVISLAGAAAPASAAVPDFFGSWYASAPDTRGITRIDVRRSGDRIFVRIWGACHPTSCDWGEAPGQAYTAEVDAPTWPEADTVTAQFDTGAEHTIVLLHRTGGELAYETFTHFQDGSGRSDYHQTARLDR